MKNEINSETLTEQQCFEIANKFEKEKKYLDAIQWYSKIINASNIELINARESYYHAYSKIGHLNTLLYQELELEGSKIQKNNPNISGAEYMDLSLIPNDSSKIFYLQAAVESYYAALTQCQYAVESAVMSLKTSNSAEQLATVEQIYKFAHQMIDSGKHVLQCGRSKHQIYAKDHEIIALDSAVELEDMINSINENFSEIKQYAALINGYSGDKAAALLHQQRELQDLIDVTTSTDLEILGHTSYS